MALRDITLGQFFPGSSPIHRLDPRAKLLGLTFFIISLFLGDGPVAYLLLFAALAAVVKVSTVKLKALVRGMRPVVLLLVITTLLNAMYTPGEPLFSFWIFTVTREGVFRALFIIVRILMLISCTFLLTYTTSPLALTDGLESLLSPLKRLHAPVHELSMMMSIALRMIPLLIEETDKIMSAQRARGANFDTGSLLQRAKALIPLLVPLFISAFRRADELATAMECRCYHGGEGRTRMSELHYRPADAAFIVGCASLCVICFVLARLGL